MKLNPSVNESINETNFKSNIQFKKNVGLNKFSKPCLVAAIVLCSLLIVNCKKASDKAAVKSKTVANKPMDPSTPSGASPDKDKPKINSIASSKLCSEDIQSEYKKLYELMTEVTKESKSKDTKISESEANRILAECETFQKKFEETKNNQCHYFAEANKQKKYFLDKSPKLCLEIAKLLKKEYQVETEYLKVAKDQAITRKEIFRQKENETESLIGTKFLISEEMKKMLKKENLNFKMYLIDGEIKTDVDERKKYFQDKKVVCSFVGTSTDVLDNTDIVLTAVTYEQLDQKNNIDNLDSVGIAFSVNQINQVLKGNETKVSTESEDLKNLGFQSLGCSHLLSEKISVQKLKKTFGKHLTTEYDLNKKSLVKTQTGQK